MSCSQSTRHDSRWLVLSCNWYKIETKKSKIVISTKKINDIEELDEIIETKFRSKRYFKQRVNHIKK